MASTAHNNAHDADSDFELDADEFRLAQSRLNSEVMGPRTQSRVEYYSSFFLRSTNNATRSNSSEADVERALATVPETDQDIECFGLLDLPPEIWSIICRLAVTRTKPTILDFWMARSKFHVQPSLQQAVEEPPITRVCKAVREETLPTFYANAFVYNDVDNPGRLPDRFVRWIDRVLVRRTYRLPDLTIKVLTYARVMEEMLNELLNEHGLQVQEVRREPVLEEDKKDVVVLQVSLASTA